MLEAYFDDSGTHRESDFVVVGGFFTTREKSESFAVEWKSFLQDEQIKRFHRVDLECFQEEFKRENGWDETRRERVVKRAHQIIGKHLGHGYIHSVVKSEYDEIVTDPSVRSKLGPNHYTFCAMLCMRQIVNIESLLGRNEPIGYFFESGTKGSSALDQLVSKMNKNGGRGYLRCQSLTFVSKYDEESEGVVFPGVVQVHAADLIAYEGYKLIQNGTNDGASVRESMQHLQSLIHIYRTHTDREALRFWVKCIQRGTVPYV